METETNVGRRGSRKHNGSTGPSKEAVLVDEEPNGQKRLEGTERLADPEIEAQAEKVKKLETKRKDILEKEVAERDILTKMMRDKKITLYPLAGDWEGYVVEVETEPKAKIHKAKKPTEPDDE